MSESRIPEAVSSSACLVDVFIIATMGERVDIIGFDGENDRGETDEVGVTLEHRITPEEGGFLAQLRATTEAPLFNISVIVGAQYSANIDDKAWFDDEEATSEFMDRMALFQLWPYLRQEIQHLTMRMGLEPVVIPLYRPKPMLGVAPPSDEQ